MSEKPVLLIPDELFACAESSCFSGIYSLAKINAGPDEYRFEAPLDWSITVTNTGDALLVEGLVTGGAKTDCARCLDEFAVTIKGEVEGYFLLSDEDAVPEGMDEDEFDILSENKTIEMKPLLDAAILLEIPLIPLCKKICRGLCSTCGENLNEVECACIKEEDEFEREKNPFSVLKDYPFG